MASKVSIARNVDIAQRVLKVFAPLVAEALGVDAPNFDTPRRYDLAYIRSQELMSMAQFLTDVGAKVLPDDDNPVVIELDAVPPQAVIDMVLSALPEGSSIQVGDDSFMLQVELVADEVVGDSLVDYEAMTVAELEKSAKDAGIYESIEGSGSGGKVIKVDLVDAMLNLEKVAEAETDGDPDE